MSNKYHENRVRLRIYRLGAIIGWSAIAGALIGLPIAVGVTYSLGAAIATLIGTLLVLCIPGFFLVVLTDKCLTLWGSVKAKEMEEAEKKQREAERIIKEYRKGTS